MSEKLIIPLAEKLSHETWEIITGISVASAALDEELWLIGGSVRDLLLNIDCQDIDLTFSGNVGTLLSVLSEDWSKLGISCASVKKNRFFSKYYTGKLILQGNIPKNLTCIDIAQTRREVYKTPAMPPIVDVGSFKEDIFRRDFSVNSLAISLNSGSIGEVIDVIGGIQDLRTGIIRILHEKSFIDDPVRLLRALRLHIRFGFTLEKRTSVLFIESARSGYLSQLPGFRICQELMKCFREEKGIEIARGLISWGLVNILAPEFENVEKSKCLSIVDSPVVEKLLHEGKDQGFVLFGAILSTIDESARQKIFKKMNIPPKWQRAMGKTIEVL